MYFESPVTPNELCLFSTSRWTESAAAKPTLIALVGMLSPQRDCRPDIMKRSTKIVALVAAAFVILLLVVALLPSKPAAKAILLRSGYGTISNGVRTAVFVLTNPGPARVNYFARRDYSTPTNGVMIMVASGTLSTRSAITFEIPLSDLPSRLLVFC